MQEPFSLDVSARYKDELLRPVQKYVRQLAATPILFLETSGTNQLVSPGCPQRHLKGILEQSWCVKVRSLAHHLWNVLSENCLFQPQGILGFYSVIIVISQDLEAAWEGEDRRVGPTYDFKRGHPTGEAHIWLLPKPPETCWVALPLSSGGLPSERVWGAMLIARV